MKTIIISFTIYIVISISALAQLSYEGKTDSRYKIFQLEDGSLKYTMYDKKQKHILIYNLDHTLWRTVEIPLPKWHFFEEIKHISQFTLNQDELVEVIYSCSVYGSTLNEEDPEGEFLYDNTLNVINDLGETILKVEGASEMKILEANNKSRLLVFKHTGKSDHRKRETLVFSF